MFKAFVMKGSLDVMKCSESVHRLEPLHQRQPSGITDRADRESPLHQKQRGPEQQNLEHRKMVGERSEHTNLVEHPAHGQTAHRPQSQCDKQSNPNIVIGTIGQQKDAPQLRGAPACRKSLPRGRLFPVKMIK